MTKTALLFPGQGSQESGMGRALAEQHKDAMELWKKAERISGLPLRGIYWEGDEAAMSDTRALQPALTVVNVALWQQLAPRFSPAGTAGHSLGEYSSLAASGALSVDSALEITSLRGRLMAEADPEGKGAMAAVLKLDADKVQAIVEEAKAMTNEILLVANYNTPGQLVVSGTKAAVEQIVTLAKEHKGRAIPLKVSGAFHSPLMEEAARELRPALEKAQWQRPRFAVYCNVHGKGVTDGDSLRQCMLNQMTSSVRWIDTMTHQWQDGLRRWVEVGPKAVLSKMVTPCLAGLMPEGQSADTLCISNAEGAESFSE